jgi:hypothetical protein
MSLYAPVSRIGFPICISSYRFLTSFSKEKDKLYEWKFGKTGYNSYILKSSMHKSDFNPNYGVSLTLTHLTAVIPLQHNGMLLSTVEETAEDQQGPGPP